MFVYNIKELKLVGGYIWVEDSKSFTKVMPVPVPKELNTDSFVGSVPNAYQKCVHCKAPASWIAKTLKIGIPIYLCNDHAKTYCKQIYCRIEPVKVDKEF
jgi:hypothetical protein